MDPRTAGDGVTEKSASHGLFCHYHSPKGLGHLIFREFALVFGNWWSITYWAALWRPICKHPTPHPHPQWMAAQCRSICHGRPVYWLCHCTMLHFAQSQASLPYHLIFCNYSKMDGDRVQENMLLGPYVISLRLGQMQRGRKVDHLFQRQVLWPWGQKGHVMICHEEELDDNTLLAW